MVIADPEVSPGELRELINMLGGVGGAAAILILLCAGVGWWIAAQIPGFPGGWGVVIGGVIGLTIALSANAAAPTPENCSRVPSSSACQYHPPPSSPQ